MGYTKIVQYGDIIETYNYTNNVSEKKLRTFSRRTRRTNNPTTRRSRASLQRAKTAFIRIVYANLYAKGSPTFITLTNFEQVGITLGYEYLRGFIKRIRRTYPELTLISVPEWQKTGRLHFHCLVWGTDKHYDKKERTHRFYQRNWGRGYADVLVAKDASPYIALYLGKYMAKASSDKRLANRRAFSTTHNITRWIQAGSNSLSNDLSTIIPFTTERLNEYTYNTAFLGQCTFTKYKLL